MKVTHLGHAALLIEVGGLRIVTDPWFGGAAYCDQWFLFPPAVPELINGLGHIDHILISHGHEDHVHQPSLERITRDARIFFPYSWYGGVVEHFQSAGFANVTEAMNGKRYALNDRVSVTFLANNLDNIIVVEGDGQVLVDCNDALTSAPKPVIERMVAEIKQRWPKVDFLFSTYGGASYFPNTIRSPWKNDEEVARVRERFFLDSFCRITSGIDPVFAIPCASDFVLLDDDQRWMNRTRTLRKDFPDYFAEHAASRGRTRILECYPGDVVTDEGIEKRSAYHAKFRTRTVDELVEEVYAQDIERKRKTTAITPARFAELVDAVRTHVQAKAHIVPAEKRKQLVFAVDITDHGGPEMIRVDITGEKPHVDTVLKSAADFDLLIQVKSNTLHYSLTEEWGGDAIVIGYGCTIHVRTRDVITNELDNWAVHLLTHYPNTKEYIKRDPLRTLNYLAHDRVKRNVFLGKLLGGKEEAPFIDPLLQDHALWLTRSNCDICKKCNFPVMPEEAAQANPST